MEGVARTREASLANAITPVDAQVSSAVAKLGRLVAAVSRTGADNSEFDQVLDVLRTLSKNEDIPIAIVGGMAAVRHGYERLTVDIDIVIARAHLDTIIRVAPRYGIKVIWQDPRGWHKLQLAGVRIEVVPEGEKPSKDAPTTIPGPKQLGVIDGMDYASLEGWMETKLGSGRRQDQADVVQVLKKASPDAVARIRAHLTGVHGLYVRLLDELAAAADAEKQQERERGGLA